MGFLPLGAILGILVVTSLQQVTSRGTRGTRLPVPTSETIPYVAEVMGAASYEETVEEDDRPAANKGRRVQRKLPEPQLTDQDLDPEPLEYTEYQGVMGRPGVDFPVLPKIPRTNFSCRKVKSSGYYADLDTGCQVFHICDGGRKISFLCPNGTIFRQSHLICDWWFRVDCERSVEQYEESAEQLAHDQMIYKKRAEEIARAMAAKEEGKLNNDSASKQSYVNNGQQGSRRNQKQKPSYSNSAEVERQVPAETASFTSNRHRFNNQLEQANLNNNGAVGSTDQPLLVSTSPTTNKTPGKVQNYRGQNNFTDQNYFQVRVRNQQIGAAPQNNNSLNQNTKQPPTRNNYNPYRGYDEHQTESQYGATSKQHFNQDYNNNNNNNKQPEQYRISPKPDTNQGYNKNYYNNQQQTQYQPQAVSKPDPSQSYNYNNNQQQTQYRSTSDTKYNEKYNNYRSTTSGSQLETSTDKSELNFKNYKGTSNSEYQTIGEHTVQEINHTPIRSQSLSQSTSTPQVVYSYHSSVKPNMVKEINYPENISQQLQSPYKTTVTPEVNYDSNVNNLKTTLRGQYQQYQTTPTPVANQEYQNYKTTIKTQYQYHTTPSPGKNPVFNNYRSISPQAQYEFQSTVKPDNSPVYNAVKYQNNSPNLLLNDQYSRINVISPAPSIYSPTKLVDNQLFLNDATSSPIFPNQPTTAQYKDVTYFNQGKSSLAQTINSLSTPQGTFTVSPQYQQTGPQSSIFTAKIKPKNKDYSFLELQRHYETSSITSPAPPVTTPYYSVPSITPSVQPVYISTNPSTPFPSTISHKNTQFTYIPNQSTTNSLPNSYRPQESFNKYATYNNSGRKEEIRPELINSLIDDGVKEKPTKRLHSPNSGVTPTSAKALHSLATYYGSPESAEDSSTILNDFGAKQPYVSDVLLNFHSVSKGRNNFEDGTTISPSTSAHNYKLPPELTKQTKDSYTHLFSDSKEQTDMDDLIAKQSGRVIGDKTTSHKPQISTELELTDEDLTDVKTESHSRLRDSSELRELAQVFSRALSAYLEDPDTFKEILAQVRPTEPNIDFTTPSPEDEVLDFSDANRGNRVGTTAANRTSILNAVVGDTKVNIAHINNLANRAKNYGRDNTIENLSVSPIAVQTFSNLIQYTTLSPTSIAYDINNIVSNTSTSEDVVGKLGSSEDPSYFPTAGSVGDASRPRYGGFHNNTRRIPKNYSPYGAGLPNNITGVPINIVSTTITPSISKISNKSNVNISVPLISEAHSVNSLLSSTNNILYNNAFSSSSEDMSDNFKEKEKLLIPSSSQSLVSASNYLRLPQNVKNENEKRPSKGAFTSTSDGDHILNEFNKEELLPYFGQQPPFENLGKPSGFQTQNPNVNLEPFILLTNSTEKEKIEQNLNINTQSSINYGNEITKNYENGFGETGTASPITERYTVVSHKNVGNDLSSEEKDSSSTWTASPSFVTMRFSETGYDDTSVNQTQSFDSTTLLQATTYHPLHGFSDHTLLTTTNVDTTTLEPDATYTNSEYETTVNSDKLSYQTTMSPDHPDYQNFLEEKAKEMFGMLNESTAGMLMNMMNQAESNLTIRRLVLLLVADRSKENKTPEESRSSLIRALLTEEGGNSDEVPNVSVTNETPTEVPSTITTTTTSSSTTQTVEKKNSRIPRIRNNSRRFNQGPPNFKVYSSAKFYRGTDSQTAVAGSNVQSSTELNNKLNSAKLYIPSASTNTNTKLPYDSDARAVELLKTLYNLAAKWG